MHEICSVDSKENLYSCCHQIFRLGFAPVHTGGAYSAPPDDLPGFEGSYFLGEGGEGKMEGRGKEGRGGEDVCSRNVQLF